MDVLITGATGLIGGAVSAALAQRGDRVIAVTRSPERARAVLPAGSEILAGDCTRPGDWQDAVPRAHAVINLAGESLAAGRWTAKRKREFRRSRLETTRRLVEAWPETGGPAVLLSGSATGYYGDGGREPLYEEREAAGDFLGRLAHEWEQTALELADRTRVCLLRFSMVLAPDGGALPRMAKIYRWGLGGRLGSGRQYMPWIHRHDAVRAILHMLNDETIAGPVNITAPDPPQQREFSDALAAAVGKPAVLPAPAFAIRLVLGEMAVLVLASSRAVPKALRAQGFAFELGDLDAALRSALGP
ncbi:MAG TPA: TIGR01777 family oxidoreductase [Candidatus Krumholzibacteria bacterium]|nr:TIGR01777 family oxidoreductase [Candidatus Krumholzibacteria bacterium]HRX51464.1 TIGR01777 family oxidoreductase [Candidatus Krumholzibacteria bacterium]